MGCGEGCVDWLIVLLFFPATWVASRSTLISFGAVCISEGILTNAHNQHISWSWTLSTILNDYYLSFIFFIFLFIYLGVYDCQRSYSYSHYGALFLLILIYYQAPFEADSTSTYYMILKSVTTLNINLLNGFVVIHPTCLYIALALWLRVHIFRSWKFTSIYLYFYNYTLFLKLQHISLISVITLLLGGWWAQQELSWGGWWNWDLIELLLLFFTLSILIYIHLEAEIIFEFLQEYWYENILIVVLFYLLSRHDLLYSVHTFVVLIDNEEWSGAKTFGLLIIIMIFLLNGFEQLVDQVIIAKYLHLTNMLHFCIVFYLYGHLFVLYGINDRFVSEIWYIKIFFFSVYIIYLYYYFISARAVTLWCGVMRISYLFYINIYGMITLFGFNKHSAALMIIHLIVFIPLFKWYLYGLPTAQRVIPRNKLLESLACPQMGISLSTCTQFSITEAQVWPDPVKNSVFFTFYGPTHMFPLLLEEIIDKTYNICYGINHFITNHIYMYKTLHEYYEIPVYLFSSLLLLLILFCCG